MTDDLHRRARELLAKLAIVAEGTTTRMDSDGAHEAPDSRPPVSLERIDTSGPDHAPAKERDLHGHWRHRFARAWDRPDQLFLFVLLAAEDLAAAHHPGRRGVKEATENEILSFRGSLPELAARFGCTMKYGESARLRNRQDPQTGEPWLWPDRGRSDLSAEAIARLKAAAEARARELLAEGASRKRVSEATGIPGRTLRRMLDGDDHVT